MLKIIHLETIVQTPSQSSPGGLSLNIIHRLIYTSEGEVFLDDSVFVRAGYSANASLLLEKKDSVMSIPEALLQFDRETNKPYVEIKDEKGKFVRKKIETGISDGLNVEILSGLELDDEIKVWNKTEPFKLDEEEEDKN